MSHTSIVNAVGANQQVTDFRTLKTTDGELLGFGFEDQFQVRANAAIAKGTVCAFNVAPAAGVVPSVGLMAVADDPRLYAGVAVNAAASGALVTLRRNGVVELFVNAQTVAYGDAVLVPGTNAGEATCTATDPAAASIVGTVLGVVWGAKNAPNLAPVILQLV